jgi:hypothetical protein
MEADALRDLWVVEYTLPGEDGSKDWTEFETAGHTLGTSKVHRDRWLTDIGKDYLMDVRCVRVGR